MNKQEDKKETLEDLYYCFRYKCKRCPKQRECEERQERGDNNGKHTEFKTSSKQGRSKRTR